MRTLCVLALALFTAPSGLAQRVGVPTTDLDNVSVDELFSVEVTSVDRKAQQLAKAPAAVFVLTAADIRRSGATSIPEALELVPGLTVLQVDGRSWDISARGGARQFADKILVLIDGRSLYTPFFSGVIWDAIDVPLDDIERIEVVRGPGAVMWGPNAVNGVINVITRSARDTRGAQTSVADGNEMKNQTEARFGAAPSDKLAWRVWGKFDDETPGYGSPGYYNFATIMTYRVPSVQNLDSGTGRMGFRVDGQPDEGNQWMIEGDLFRTDRQDPVATPVYYPSVMQQGQSTSNYFGGYLDGSWTHSTGTGEDTLQMSFDQTDLHYTVAAGDLRNLNINYQSRLETGEHNEFYWGAGYQQYWDSTGHTGWMNYNPASATYRDGDVVARDEWQFVPGLLTASAGIRLDYNSYRQLEYQPSLRLLYTPDARQSAWLAASRAIREPDRVDRDLDEYGGAEMVLGLVDQLWVYGTKTMRSEVERSVEAGYRFQSGQVWSVDASLFFSDYERLRAVENSGLPQIAVQNGMLTLLSSSYMCNCGSGQSYGAEVWGVWHIRSNWRLSPSYSYLKARNRLPDSSYLHYVWDGTPEDLTHQGFIRSEHDLAHHLQLDLTVRGRSRDEDLYRIPGVVLFDARLAWKPWHTGEFSLTVHNLAGREVWEGFPELQTVAIPIRRTFVVKWTQRF